jgi:hypothetical protein
MLELKSHVGIILRFHLILTAARVESSTKGCNLSDHFLHTQVPPKDRRRRGRRLNPNDVNRWDGKASEAQTPQSIY